jgi:hypothetical protein
MIEAADLADEEAAENMVQLLMGDEPEGKE